MDDGGNKSEFELEVSDKDVELVSADIESPGDEGAELPVDDAELTEGDIEEPVDPDEEPKKPEDKPEEEPHDEEKPAEEEKPEEEGPSEDELDSELDELEAEENSEDTTVADEEKAEEEKPAEEESHEEDAAAVAAMDEALADDDEEKPAEEESHEEEAPAEEEKPAEEDKPAENPEDTPIVVEGENAPVDSTAANSTFPVEPAKETKDNKSKIGLFVMIAIIVLLLIGCGIFALMNGNKPAKKGGSGSDETSKTENDGKLARELNIKLLKDWASNENVIFSPLSIKYVLAMLVDATEGDTKQELTALIGENYEPKKYTSSKNLVVSNAMFVRDDFRNAIKTAYTDAIKKKYNANTIYDPFNSASTINDWVKTNTLSLIPKILEDEDVESLNFVLINAVAIDMNWVNNFQCSHDGKEVRGSCISYSVDFAHEKYGDSVGAYYGPTKMQFGTMNNAASVKLGTTLNNYDIIKEIGEDTIRSTVKEAYDKWKESADEYQIKAMENAGYETFDDYFADYIKELGKNYGQVAYSTDYTMYIDDDVKVFAKDLKEYDGTQLQYVGIMPRKVELNSFVKDISNDKIDDYIGKLKEIKSENFTQGKVVKIKANMPIFNYNSGYDLKEELEKLGVKSMFSATGDLSPMTDVEEAKFTEAAHAAMIDFSNEGIKAAAVTLAGGMGAGGDPFDYLWDVPVEEIDMTFDRPFMYLIRDKKTGEVWFMGTVYEPKTM